MVELPDQLDRLDIDLLQELLGDASSGTGSFRVSVVATFAGIDRLRQICKHKAAEAPIKSNEESGQRPVNDYLAVSPPLWREEV